MTSYGPSTALLVVDIQNDFAHPDGSLFVPGAGDVIDPINAEIARAKTGRATVVYTQDWHPPTTPHFAKDGGIWPVHCVAGTWGAQLHGDLVLGGEVIRKGADGRDGYSGFSVRDARTGDVGTTGLEAHLRGRSIRRVVVAGVATDYCVVETVSDARMLGFEVEVLADAIRAVDREPGDGDRAITRMRDAGADVT